jgi:accessory gene regulator B
MSLSNYITDCLIDGNIIKESERKVYNYCLNGLFEYLFFSVSILILSVLVQHVSAGILFLSMMFFIKSFSGGIHAGNSIICYIASCSVFLLLNLISCHLYPYINHPGLAFLLYLISMIVKPVSCPQKRISRKKLRNSLKIYGFSGLIFLLTSVSLYTDERYYESSFINLTFLGIVILQILGRVIYKTKERK